MKRVPNEKGGIILENCKNPWKNSCQSGNIKLYILLEGEKLPICKHCWSSIAEQKKEWGN